MSIPPPSGTPETDLVDLCPVLEALGDTKMLEIGTATPTALVDPHEPEVLLSLLPDGAAIEDHTGAWGPVIAAIRAHPSPLVLIHRGEDLERVCYGISYADRGLVGVMLEEADEAGRRRFVLLGIHACAMLLQRALFAPRAAPRHVDIWYPHPTSPRRVRLTVADGDVISISTDGEHFSILTDRTGDTTGIEQLLARGADEL